MLFIRRPDHERHEEPLDVANDALERDGLDLEPVLRVERAPLALLRFIFREFGSKRSWRRGDGGHCGLPPFKRPRNCLGEDRVIEREKLRQGAEVMKLLHPAVGNPEFQQSGFVCAGGAP
jgi:hypothetical protein